MDDERSSETAGSQDPPGAVSDQNHEEGPGGSGGSSPGVKDESDAAGQEAGRKRRDEPERPGGAGEHSQATGDPHSAG